MKIPRLALLLPLALLALPLQAGTQNVPSSDSKEIVPESKMPIPFEVNVEVAYIGDSDVARGTRRVNDFDEIYSDARFVYTPRVMFGILRLGVNWERFSFLDMPNGVQTPDTLQSVSGVIGLDTQFSDSILFRIEAQPGLYGTQSLDGDTFDVPVIIGGTYIYSSDLQFVFGVSVDFDRKYPVFPGGGIRWRLSSQWVLDAVVPTPRLEFEAMKNMTFYAGANLKGSVFRTEDRFGNSVGDTRLNNALVTYTEVRTGVGVEWKIAPEIKFSAEAGYMPYREFDFDRADVRYHHEGGAPYGALALTATY